MLTVTRAEDGNLELSIVFTSELSFPVVELDDMLRQPTTQPTYDFQITFRGSDMVMMETEKNNHTNVS